MKCGTKRMAKGGELSAYEKKVLKEQKEADKDAADGKAAGGAYDKSMINTPAAPKKYAKGGYTGTDARGRRTTQSDSRVSEGTKAELPAYGFKDMTLGDIASERKRVKQEREGRKEAAGYAKGGEVTPRGYGMARAGKKCRMV